MKKQTAMSEQDEQQQTEQDKPLPELTKLCISVPEMAEYLSIGVVTAYNMVNMESFYPAFKVGKKHLISVEALRRWIDEQTQRDVTAC